MTNSRYDRYTLIRAISCVEAALRWADELPRTDYGSATDSFRHHCHEAIYQLRLWGQANNLDIEAST